MRAAVLQFPGKISIKDVPDPVMGDYNVLCEILASAICSGTDNNIVRGNEYHKVSFPAILGHEAIGRVIACGPKTKYFKVGDLITRIINKLPEDSRYSLKYGAFAEKGIVVDWRAMRDDGIDKKIWQKHTVHRVLPEDFDPISSTMIITWRETYSFLKRISPKKEDTVLIIGSGANALAFTDHAKNIGLETIVIGSLKREKQFLNAGAKTVISYKEKNYIKNIRKNWYKKIDVIIDAVGKSNTLNKTVPLLAHGGKIGVYGLDGFLNYKIAIDKIPGDFHYYSGEIYDEGSAHDDIINYIKDGKLDAWNYLSKEHIYPLEKINEALEVTAKRKVLKSVIKF